MSEIVNLRRTRKTKARAQKERQAEANRAKHGTPKHLRDLTKAQAEKATHDIAGHRLDEDGQS